LPWAVLEALKVTVILIKGYAATPSGSLKTIRTHGEYVIPTPEATKLVRRYEKYGVERKEGEAESPALP
jgi:hypothetical protein